MMAKRLARALSRAEPENKLPSETIDFIRKNNLISVTDALR